MEEISIIGTDLAKHTFQIHGATVDGRPVFSKKVRRSKLLSLLANIPTCIVAMEACSSSHHWGREIGKLGHTVKMVPPHDAFCRSEEC